MKGDPAMVETRIGAAVTSGARAFLSLQARWSVY